MTYLFDTDDLSDLTDAQMQVVADIFDYGKAMTELRFWARWQSPLAVAIIALARLMRDHPELFPKPVDPLLEEARKVAANVLCLLPDEAKQLGEGDEVFDAALSALKRGMELAKGGEA